MSQNLGDQPSDSQASFCRASNENRERKNREWFGSMNYEQRRQPYNSQKVNYRNEDRKESNDANPHDEI